MAFKAFFVFYISLHFASFHNDAIVKGNDLNDLISERKQETPLKRVLVFLLYFYSYVLVNSFTCETNITLFYVKKKKKIVEYFMSI